MAEEFATEQTHHASLDVPVQAVSPADSAKKAEVVEMTNSLARIVDTNLLVDVVVAEADFVEIRRVLVVDDFGLVERTVVRLVGRQLVRVLDAAPVFEMFPFTC